MDTQTSTTDAPATSSPIRVLCVDDHHSITWVLRLVIDAEADMRCVGCVSSCNHLVEDVRKADAEVVLLDATMPGKSPLEALGELSKALPQVKTIIYTAHDNEDIINRLLRAGAWGFVSKNDNPESIVNAVRKAAVA